MRVKEVISEMKNDHFDVVAQMKRKAKEKYGTGHPVRLCVYVCVCVINHWGRMNQFCHLS
jgi:hypothetical protein